MKKFKLTEEQCNYLIEVISNYREYLLYGDVIGCWVDKEIIATKELINILSDGK